MQRVTPTRTESWTEFAEVSSTIRWTDILVYALILGFGALEFFCCAQAPDFLYDDVFFADAGRSLVEHGFYGINGYSETNQPPGLPWILGMLCMAGACSHVVFLRTMAVFGTLGFLVTYELLRRQAPRIVGAAICLLLIASPIQFSFVSLVSPNLPYFLTSVSALLVARKFEGSTRLASRIGWGALLTALIVASLMFASAAIAFLGAIVASISVILLGDRRLAFARLRTYLAVLLVGIAGQGLWMHQRIEASSGIAAEEWPVQGFPHSYLSQLKVKNGHYPELGTATPVDIAVRVVKNAYQYSYLLAEMLLHRSAHITWMSILVVGPLVLTTLGWFCSIWPRGGGLQEWYFGGYVSMYLLWPWSPEPRFFLPVAPLASLYVWRGLGPLLFLAKKQPRVFGAVWFPFAVILTTGTWLWMHGASLAGHLSRGGLEDKASLLIWLLSAIFAAWMVWADTAWLTSASALLRRCFGPIGAVQISPVRILQVSGTVVAAMVVIGLATQLKIARANLDLNSAANRFPPDAEAGVWIRSHTDANAVVMARHVPIVYHYSKRSVIWFPPNSNPQLLMEGIRRHKVDFVIVVRRQSSYYLPTDDDCFAPLLTAYPDAFRLVYQAPELRIFSARDERVSAEP
jgi:hypothetical protein